MSELDHTNFDGAFLKKEDLLAFLKQHELAVVSTVTAGHQPQSAVIWFGELDDLTIVFDTKNTSRKYKNIQANPKVSFVIGWDDNITVQVDAVAKEVFGRELETAKQVFFAKNPKAKKWEDDPEVIYFTCKPTWLRYSDFRKEPWIVEEFTF